jgi:hypothetical protein
MDTTSPTKAPQGAAQAPLRPLTAPSRIRYGLINPNGEYLVRPYQVDGKWHEWHFEPDTAVAWVDFDAISDAAKVWNSLHFDNGPVVVVKL